MGSRVKFKIRWKSRKVQITEHQTHRRIWTQSQLQLEDETDRGGAKASRW